MQLRGQKDTLLPSLALDELANLEKAGKHNSWFENIAVNSTSRRKGRINFDTFPPRAEQQ